MFELFFKEMDQNKVSVRSYLTLQQLLDENPYLKEILLNNSEIEIIHQKLRDWVYSELGANSAGILYFERKISGRKALRQLTWKEVAGIRILDYITHAGQRVEDANLKNSVTIIQPFKILWMATKFGNGGAKYDFFIDMLQLFRQFNGTQKHNLPNKQTVLNWMERHPSGSDEKVKKIREKNKQRIIRVLITKVKEKSKTDSRYSFADNLSTDEKIALVNQWWDDWNFHLKFAVRDPETMNEMLDYSITPETIAILNDARAAGIPFFVNPYYLSLLNVREYAFAPGADMVIRDYVFYSKQLIKEFGKIVAWEKEDLVKPGEPNAAGWLLPSAHNIHRRYPEVAILIPDTVGRACGGLCVSCQRMYDFQSGHLNFDLNRLKPDGTWRERLEKLMEYYENDSQLRDILITGGDALMSSNASIKEILEAVYQMALRKIEANKKRPAGKKYAEMVRVRLGTRLPVYLPQRINNELCEILKDFKHKASKIGFKQFVIQTHFITSMEVTAEAAEGVRKLQQAGWMVANQMVFTTAASVRGHASKLRKILNDIGVLSYYTFSVKGFKENSHNFATNARAVQESVEEKVIGTIPEKELKTIAGFPEQAENMQQLVDDIRTKESLPFLATDRNVMNIPGVGKSLTFRVIGITRFGYRILEFYHDATRTHSPIIEKLGNFVVVESKTIRQYLRQLERMGEDPNDYHTVYGYSIGETEPRMSIYEYPEYEEGITSEYTNLDY
ncbi:MAG: KamA family radical SAM protein [Salinivirgaceae bacterium]